MDTARSQMCLFSITEGSAILPYTEIGKRNGILSANRYLVRTALMFLVRMYKCSGRPSADTKPHFS